MSITPRKKFLVISSDMYDRVIKHSPKSYQSEKNELIKSEEEIQDVWNTSVPPHEKVKQFTEVLNQFRSLLKTMAEPVKVQIYHQSETARTSDDTSTQESTTNEIDETIAQGLAKANRRKGSILLDFLRIHPDKFIWNENGQLIIKERLFMDQI